MISIKPVLKNADSSICDNLDLDSNVTKESNSHTEKHSALKTSIDVGIMTDFRSVSENAFFSIFNNFDPNSNAIDLMSFRR
jgi:hypothetical protein